MLELLKLERHHVPLGINLTGCLADYGLFTELPNPYNRLGKRVLGVAVTLCAACRNQGCPAAADCGQCCGPVPPLRQCLQFRTHRLHHAAPRIPVPAGRRRHASSIAISTCRSWRRRCSRTATTIFMKSPTRSTPWRRPGWLRLRARRDAPMPTQRANLAAQTQRSRRPTPG